MLFLWGFIGAAFGGAMLLLAPLTLVSDLHWPGYSEAQVRLGSFCLSRWHAAGPNWPTPPWRQRAAPAKDRGAAAPAGGGMAREAAAFLAGLRRTRVRVKQLDIEGGTGDPAVTALLYGTAWAVLGGLLAARGQQARPRLVPRLTGPAGGRLDASAEVSVTPLQMLLAVLGAVRAVRRTA